MIRWSAGPAVSAVSVGSADFQTDTAGDSAYFMAYNTKV